MLLFGLRLGQARAVITTTPRPTDLIRKIQKDPATVETVGSTYENRANLAPEFFTTILTTYEGTRLGRQELLAEMLEEVQGALWKIDDIERARVKRAPALTQVVVAIDPAATSKAASDETGIVVAGVDTEGQTYVLADYSGRYSPDAWARRVVRAFEEFAADRVVAEVNNGGDLVEHTVRTVSPNVPFKSVHASRGKEVRAEPVAALYEQGKVHHVGVHAQLEDQMTNWIPGVSRSSPDRMDALVWALTALVIATSRMSSEGIFRFYEEAVETLAARQAASLPAAPLTPTIRIFEQPGPAENPQRLLSRELGRILRRW
jgi:phage terminase large subunit-like protein